MSDTLSYPRHIAIIMDGNGRWALKRNRPRTFGHFHGISAMRKTIRHALVRHIPYLTLFAFGQDNWQRSASEVSYLMHLLSRLLIQRELARLKRAGIVIRFIGDRTQLFSLFPHLRDLMAHAESQTVDEEKMRLTIALSYSGRWDLLQAAQKMAIAASQGDRALDEDMFRRYLSLDPNVPDPDLLIRTSGVQRLSDFLLWYLSYTELYFSDVFWPDFDTVQFDKALEEFSKRKRRFGREATEADLT